MLDQKEDAKEQPQLPLNANALPWDFDFKHDFNSWGSSSSPPSARFFPRPRIRRAIVLSIRFSRNNLNQPRAPREHILQSAERALLR